MEIERWKERFLRIETAGLKVGNVIWASELKRNGLYKINLEQERIEFVDRFPVEIVNWAFLDVINEAENLVFIPYSANELVVYNIDTQRFRSIDVKGGVNEKYQFGCIYSGNIYLFPDVGDRIAKVDSNLTKVLYSEDVCRDLKTSFSIDHLFFSRYLYGEDIYLPLYHRSIVVKYNFKMENYEIYAIGEHSNIGIMDCFGENERLLLLDRYGTVYEFNLYTQNVQFVFSMKDGTIEPYSAICLYKDEIWLIPFRKKQIVIYDMKNGDKTFLNISLEENIVNQSGESINKDNRLMFIKVFVEGDKLWMYPKDIEWVVEVDMEARKMKGFRPFLPVERNWSLSGYIVRGGGVFPDDNDGKNTSKNIGRSIYLAVNGLTIS